MTYITKCLTNVQKINSKYLTFSPTKNITKSTGHREKRNEESNTKIPTGKNIERKERPSKVKYLLDMLQGAKLTGAGAAATALARAAVGIGNGFSSLIHPVS
jgi:hypothetical protein